MTRNRDHARLHDMLEYAVKAVALCDGRTRGDLDHDATLQLALARALEIVGEAARMVSEHSRQSIPEIPWREIVATRNRLIHAYRDIDWDVLWKVVTDHLPPLIDVLRRHLLPSQR